MKKRFFCILLVLSLLGGLALPARAVEDALDQYISENITAAMTLEQKLDAICRFVAGYDYSPYASTMAQMLASGGGDSYAGSEILLAFCQKLGLSATLRASDRDGNGTMVNVLVEGDGVYYQLETGFQELAPRPYEITLRTSLFSYRQVEGGIAVYQYDGAEPHTLNVPQTIDGHSVVAIGDRFLASCESITEVTLPETVVRIGEDAFNGCKNLAALDIPKGVTSIGARAFSGCASLLNLTSSSDSFQVAEHILYNGDMTSVLAAPASRVAILPASVISIAPYAFQCASNLEAVVIPAGVRTIGEGAFADCDQLEMITFRGLAPELGEFLFFAVTADAYAAWESQEDGYGNITWNSYTSNAEYSAEYDESAQVTKLHVLVWGEGEVLIPMKITQLQVDVTMESEGATLQAVLKAPSHGYVFLQQRGNTWQVLPQTQVTADGIELDVQESCTLLIQDKSLRFPDVGANSWARYAVDYLTARGLMAGKLDGTFGLEDTIQRQTVAMMLWRMAGSPQVEGQSPFQDATGGRYLMAILWAYQNGIISGYADGTFRPTETISRQHFALMLYRYARLKGIALTKQDNGTLTDFSDYALMNRRMYEAMQWGLDHGLILGKTDGTYDPEGGTTRAQMAVILTRFLKQIR